jgi:hypothetical protein
MSGSPFSFLGTGVRKTIQEDIEEIIRCRHEVETLDVGPMLDDPRLQVALFDDERAALQLYRNGRSLLEIAQLSGRTVEDIEEQLQAGRDRLRRCARALNVD